MAEVLFACCPSCETEFPSRCIQMDRGSFESCDIGMNEEPCPSCGIPVLITKDFLFFRDEE